MTFNEYHIELISLSPRLLQPIEPTIYTAKFIIGKVILG